MSTANLWTVLGIAPTREVAVIRRAYAARLKALDPEAEPLSFQQLRYAYERALQLAAARDSGPLTAETASSGLEPSVAAPAAGAAAPEPGQPGAPAAATQAPAHPDSPSGSDAAALAAGEAAFRQLGASLAPDADAALRAQVDEAFSTLIGVIGNLDITRQYYGEEALARLLLGNAPRSDGLLVRAAKRFGWRESGHGANDVFGSALLRLQALDQEENLASGKHPLSAAYRLLKREPRPRNWAYRTMALLRDHQVRALFELIRAGAMALVPSLHPQAYAWWVKRLTQPHVTRKTLAIAAILLPLSTVVFCILDIAHDVPPDELWWHVAAGAVLVGALAIPIQLYLIEWPRWQLRKRWARRLPRVAAYGWFPSGLLLVALAGFLPSGWSLYLTFPLALLMALWAHITEPDIVTGSGEPPSRSALLNVVKARVILNIPLGLFLLFGAASATTMGCSLTAFAQTLATTLGYTSISRAWALDHTQRERWTILWLLPVVALLLGAALVLQRLGPLKSEIALTSALVLIQRPISAGLTGSLLKIRYYLLYISYLAIVGVYSGSTFAARFADASFAHAMTVWFAFGVLASAVFAIVRERERFPGDDD